MRVRLDVDEWAADFRFPPRLPRLSGADAPDIDRGRGPRVWAMPGCRDVGLLAGLDGPQPPAVADNGPPRFAARPLPARRHPVLGGQCGEAWRRVQSPRWYECH